MNEKISFVDYLKKVKIGLVLLGVAIFIFIGNAVVSSAYYDSQLATYKSDKQALTSQLEQAKIAAQKATSGSQEAVSGLDIKRVSADDKIFNDFLTSCLNWKSVDEYVAMRSKLTSDYKAGEVSTFMTVMFPDVMNMSDNSLEQGISDFVTNITLTSKDMVSHVKSIDANVYSYFTEVTLAASNEKECKVIITYSIDGGGALSNLGASVVD